ncbi:hypothetical protein OE88DRAFT_1664362 [Heliocybe sulcata]|uniref:Uncharacterized protein n=1 Tax=Heliocybe sulcata TaxID=5364 RepID=A0A5C3MXN4_9AGAM|nr:hypothetical protein OE88DRAFT_1664362 [Heliocybe sulcata]
MSPSGNKVCLTLTTTCSSSSDSSNHHQFVSPGYIYIRNQSGDTTYAFVTKLSGDGNDNWFTVPASFDENSLWKRASSGWELIAFKDDDDRRVGFYVEVKKVTTYVTFHSFDNVEIDRVGA